MANKLSKRRDLGVFKKSTNREGWITLNFNGWRRNIVCVCVCVFVRMYNAAESKNFTFTIAISFLTF